MKKDVQNKSSENRNKALFGKTKTSEPGINVRFLSVVTIAILAIILCVAATVLIVNANKKPKKQYALPNQIYYFPARYDEDIFQNTAYMTFDRTLLFGSQGYQSIYRYEEDRESAPEEAKFFLDYFQCLIQGDGAGITAFFVPGYFEDENHFTEQMVDGKPHFTMQMIHDISVILHSVDNEKIDGEETSVYSYTVNYAIYHNNGTWRKGVGNDEIRPQIYQLIRYEDGSYRIWRILDVFVDDGFEE